MTVGWISHNGLAELEGQAHGVLIIWITRDLRDPTAAHAYFEGQGALCTCHEEESAASSANGSPPFGSWVRWRRLAPPSMLLAAHILQEQADRCQAIWDQACRSKTS
eukprot:scaffold223580_cov27-Tisochrysis_lutea.AAC.1